MPTIRLDLNELERELGSEAADFMLELSNELINQFKQNVNTGATGDLQRSFQIFRRGDGVIYLGSNLPYALWHDTGTDPIQNPPPPFAPFQTWARRVLGDQSAAGAVWNKIRQEGVDAHPYLQRSMDAAIERVA